MDSGLGDSQLTDLDLDLDNPEVGVPSTPIPLDTTEAISPRPPSAAQFQSSTLKMPLAGDEPSSDSDRRNEPLVFDLSGITLDLDQPGSATHAKDDGGDLAVIEDESDGDPVSRKMELAEEFQRIGDKDGARDLLREVLSTATGSTKSKAQSMLEDLG
jgi:pilus assembly protein FimV